MTQFVRFRVDAPGRFAALQQVFAEIKAVKNLDFRDESHSTDSLDDENVDYDLDRLRGLIPEDVCANFTWPSLAELRDHKLDPTKPIAISPPGSLLGAEWSLVRILDLIDTCEYSLDRCELVNDDIAELHVETWSYPYGGLNAIMVLIEGFGFHILGVDECGKYESREELERDHR